MKRETRGTKTQLTKNKSFKQVGHDGFHPAELVNPLLLGQIYLVLRQISLKLGRKHARESHGSCMPQISSTSFGAAMVLKTDPWRSAL